MKRRYLMLGAVAGAGIALLPVWLASAASTTFSQRILPMDCVFETVNDGTGILHYLTPAACGVLLPPSSLPTLAPAAPDTIIQRAPAPTPANQLIQNTSNIVLPWQPIASPAKGTGNATASSTVLTTLVVAASTVGILVLIAALVLVI